MESRRVEGRHGGFSEMHQPAQGKGPKEGVEDGDHLHPKISGMEVRAKCRALAKWLTGPPENMLIREDLGTYLKGSTLKTHG